MRIVLRNQWFSCHDNYKINLFATAVYLLRYINWSMKYSNYLLKFVKKLIQSCELNI